MNNPDKIESFEKSVNAWRTGWVYLFIGQLVVGGHEIYKLADEYPDMGIISYAVVLMIGSAIIATVLLGIVGVCYFIAKVIYERVHRNDSS